MDNAAYATGKWPKDKDHGAGPVKAACLSCRQKKAKCDGVKPVCGQVSCSHELGAEKRRGMQTSGRADAAVRTRGGRLWEGCGRWEEQTETEPRPRRGRDRDNG
jgi:hypothetical protein